MQTKHVTLLFFLLWLGASPAWGQRFQNASDFMGDSAQDQLIYERGIDLPSNELLLYQPQNDLQQLPRRQDAFQVFDFLGRTNDPEQNLIARRRYLFDEIDPQGTTASDLPGTPEMTAVVGDFDGDGFDEVIRAMEDDHGEILCFFYDSVAVGTDNSEIPLLDKSSLLYRIPAPAGGYLPVLDGHPTLKLKTVNLGESKRDHLIVSYLRRVSSSLFQLSIDLWQDTLVARTTLNIPFADGHAYNLAPHFDFDAGDFELDGVPEIAVVYQEMDSFVVSSDGFEAFMHPQLTILKLDQSQLVVKREESLNMRIDAYEHSSTPPSPTAIGGRAKFQRTVHILLKDLDADMVPELTLLAPGFSYHAVRNLYGFGSSRSYQVYHMSGKGYKAWGDTAKQGFNAFDTLIQVSQFNKDMYSDGSPTYSPLGPFQLSTYATWGEVDGDPLPELVHGYYVHRHSGGSSQTSGFGFGVEELERSPQNPDTLLLTSGDERMGFLYTWESYPTPRRFLEVSDLDGDGIQEIIRYRKTGGNTLLKAFRYISRGTSGNPGSLEKIGQRSFATPTGASFQLLSGDFDGDGLWLGRSRYFRKTNIQQPLIILNAPPVHFDVFGGRNYDINDCFKDEENGDENDGDCEFYTGYTISRQSEFSAETQFNSQAAVSASLQASTQGFGQKLESKISATYGKSFSRYRGSGKTVRFTEAIRTGVDDQIFANIIEYGIYEYPVYQGDSLRGHLMTITPELAGRRWFGSKDWSAREYFPRHEVGNILSYQDLGGNNNQSAIPSDPTIAELIHYEGNQVNIGPQSRSYEWTAAFSDFSSQKTSYGNSLSVNSSTSYTAGAQLLGQGSEISVSLSSDYSQEEVRTYSTKMSEAIKLDVKLTKTAGLQASYTVQPFFYWAKNGALVIDYSVRPEVSGTSENFWSANYGKEQDPAWILPWRLDPERGIELTEEITRHLSKSITYSPQDASPGDEITIYAAVHNYSLVPTDGPVEVAFYLGNPSCPGSQRLTSLDGEQSAFTGDFIEPQGRSLVSFRWKIPEDITSQPRIFGLIDPEEQMDEIHEANNLGWTSLNVLTNTPTQYCNEVTTSLSFEQEAAQQVLAFPNPFTQQTTLRFDLPQGSEVKLEVLDLTGRRVATLIDGFRFAGQQEVTFDGADRPAGVYLYRLQVGEQVQSGKLHLQR